MARGKEAKAGVVDLKEEEVRVEEGPEAEEDEEVEVAEVAKGACVHLGNLHLKCVFTILSATTSTAHSNTLKEKSEMVTSSRLPKVLQWLLFLLLPRLLLQNDALAQGTQRNKKY